MNAQRPGCLSPLAVISALITLLVLIGVGVNSGFAMFSPGPLNATTGPALGGVNSHAEMEQDCGRCHAPFWSSTTMSDLCMECHQAVRQELRDPTTLHGSFAQTQPIVCQDCHTEHHGPTASLTVMDATSFPHQITGFSLTAHVRQANGDPFTCNDCHGERLTSFDPGRCLGCHQGLDEAYMADHVQAFGAACLECHDGVDRFSDFDHARTQFDLLGQHRNLTCEQCHVNTRTLVDFQAAPTTCEGCHLQDDAHQGRFGTNCGVCHHPEGWKPAQFDHNLAAFKLEGKHASVQCEACHVNGQFKGTPQDCFSCHRQDDPHQGRFGTACETCHTPNGWKPAQFDHNLAAFKLEGKHASVQCEACHVNGQFKGTPQDCFSCHRQDDPHQGRFGTACETCHTPNGWKPAQFDHNLAAFKLEGKHASVQCEACHVNGQFKGTPQDCFSCHRKDDRHNGQFGTACEACHTPVSWSNVTFDHNRSRFPLTGAHATVQCTRCHQNGVFRGTPTECAACHAEPAFHAGLFRGQSCGSCHSTVAWRPAQYNGPHTFPMNHGGARLCSDCHRPNLTTWTCYTCHNPTKISQKHLKEGISNFTNCVACHPTGREHEGEEHEEGKEKKGEDDDDDD